MSFKDGFNFGIGFICANILVSIIGIMWLKVFLMWFGTDIKNFITSIFTF